MKKNIIYISWFMVFGLIGCQSNQNETDEEKTMNDMVINDVHTYANASEVVVKHLDWLAEVDFDNKLIKAVATLSLDKQPDANQLILDTKDLNISKVTLDENQVEVTFSLGNTDQILGTPLIINIEPNTQYVHIHYTTGPDAEALQWLTPQQAGGEQPFLFTQSQAILARSWVPIQDSPGIRFTYSAKVKTPPGMLALMSAENPMEKSADGLYEFEMRQPIPAYLLALSVGDITFKSLSDRTGVYAIPDVIDKAVYEFGELEDMVKAAEALYGPYQWERYDLLVLPPSFPFGGMENPRLTFATPTILAGDRSLTALIAHELAHSWSGNLVTNGTWNDFWLNEGFTVYFEHRIMEKLYGKEYAEMLASLSMQGLQEEVNHMMTHSGKEDTKLKLNLLGRSPDDGMTAIAYDKGYFFLRQIEESVGREKFDNFLKTYFTENAFKVMTTEAFIKYLNSNLYQANGLEIDTTLYDRWIYGSGLPSQKPNPTSSKFAVVDNVIKDWVGGKSIADLVTKEQIASNAWSTHEWLHFLRNLPGDLPVAQMQSLDKHLGFSDSGNAEILASWFKLAIKHDYKPAFPNMEKFLVNTGRRKFLSPLYEEMMKTETGSAMARSIYQKARPNYHYVSSNSIDKLLNYKEEN